MQPFLKSLLIGAAYALTIALTKLILSQSVDTPWLLWSFAGGTVIGLTLGLLAPSMPDAWTRHLLVWGSIVFFNIASVTTEGRFFAPDLVQGSMVVLLFQQLVVAFVATWLIVKLCAPMPLILLAASAVEIFFQNYLTGVVSARLPGRA